MILRKAVQVLVIVGLPVLASVFIIHLAQAHGSMQSPVSRVYNCFLENPERPISAACQAAIALGGTQAMYDWNGLRQGNAAGNHQALIPDGKLCSANVDEFKGLDLVRTDWVTTTLPTSGNFTFSFKVTAPHRGTMALYVTRNGYNPALPLRWADLEATPFTSIPTDVNPPNGVYSWTAPLPTGKSGRHLIYMIWQRSDSPEAFYSCSDVIFGSGGSNPTATRTPTGPTATPTRTPTGPTMTPTRTPTVVVGGAPAWDGNSHPYAVGNLVTFNGVVYRCIQAHTSQPAWTPAAVGSLWQVN